MRFQNNTIIRRKAYLYLEGKKRKVIFTEKGKISMKKAYFYIWKNIPLRFVSYNYVLKKIRCKSNLSKRDINEAILFLIRKNLVWVRNSQSNPLLYRIVRQHLSLKRYSSRNIFNTRTFHLDIKNPSIHFDSYETTVSYLLRKPHPCLGNKSYGQIVCKKILSPKYNLEPLSILEIGAGRGDLACGFLKEIRNLKVKYISLDLSKEFLFYQRKLLKKFSKVVKYINADACLLPFKDESFHIVICNEMMADLPTVKINKKYLLKNPEKIKNYYIRETVNFIRKYKIKVKSLFEDFLINTGALKLMVEISRVLKRKGKAIIVEYGGINAPVVEQRCGAHIEYSIDFGTLIHIASSLNLKYKIYRLKDFLDIDNSYKIISRESMRSLWVAAILSNEYIPFFAYTSCDLNVLLRSKLKNLEGFYFCKPNSPDSVLGIQDFWALVLQKN